LDWFETKEVAQEEVEVAVEVVGLELEEDEAKVESAFGGSSVKVRWEV
jgi:hypothetical protein